MKHQFKVNDLALVRIPTRCNGPVTHQIKVVKILAMTDDVATVTSNTALGGRTIRQEIAITSLAPVTESFKRNSVQVSPQFHRGGLMMQ